MIEMPGRFAGGTEVRIKEIGRGRERWAEAGGQEGGGAREDDDDARRDAQRSEEERGQGAGFTNESSLLFSQLLGTHMHARTH